MISTAATPVGRCNAQHGVLELFTLGKAFYRTRAVPTGIDEHIYVMVLREGSLVMHFRYTDPIPVLTSTGPSSNMPVNPTHQEFSWLPTRTDSPTTRSSAWLRKTDDGIARECKQNRHYTRQRHRSTSSRTYRALVRHIQSECVRQNRRTS